MIVRVKVIKEQLKAVDRYIEKLVQHRKLEVDVARRVFIKAIIMEYLETIWLVLIMF